MVIAKISVNGVVARATYRSKIPQGIVGATVEFDYTDPMWAGLKKTVIFWSSAVKDILDAGESVIVPAEVVAQAGCRLRVGIYGVDLSGNTVIPTLWADLGPVEGSADPSLDPSAKDELPVWAQLQLQIGDLAQLKTLSKESLVAAINELIAEFEEYDKSQVQRITELLQETLRQAEQSGEFDGPPGPVGPAGPVGADGAPGKDGSIGADGFSPSVKITQTESGAVISVTDKDGTTTATIESGAPGPAGPAGAPGKDGKDGADGAPGADGKDGADGKTPVAGVDYFTEADKEEMVDAVLEAMPEDTVATNVDLSAYESSGIIKETFGDGTSKTTTVEFDADGNPVKITDGDGNITVLAW